MRLALTIQDRQNDSVWDRKRPAELRTVSEESITAELLSIASIPWDGWVHPKTREDIVKAKRNSLKPVFFVAQL